MDSTCWSTWAASRKPLIDRALEITEGTQNKAARLLDVTPQALSNFLQTKGTIEVDRIATTFESSAAEQYGKAQLTSAAPGFVVHCEALATASRPDSSEGQSFKKYFLPYSAYAFAETQSGTCEIVPRKNRPENRLR